MDTKKNQVPLSQTQLGIYIESVRMGGNAYNRHYLYKLDPSLDMNRLARAVEQAVDAHPYMRVRLAQDSTDGTITQFIPDNESPYHQTVKKMTESQWRKELSDITSTPCKLIGERLIRIDLIETECAKYLLRTAHHVVVDGMSQNLILRYITAAYEGTEQPQEPYTALDIAEAESHLRSGAEYQHAKEWYEERFSGLAVESLPLPDKNDNPSRAVSAHTFNLSEQDMKTFCRQEKISTSALTSGAFALLTGTYTNQQESLFSTVYHGRQKDGANVIGMFVKTLPVYARWDDGTKTTDFLKALSEQIKGSRENSLFSFADVNNICPMSNKPLFAWHSTVRTRLEFCGKPVEEEYADKYYSDAPMLCELMSVPQGLLMRIEYNAGMYSAEMIKTFATTYEQILRQLLTKEYIRDIEPCPQESDEMKLLDSFNDTDVPYDNTQTVTSLFMKSAEQHKDSTAVIFRDKHYTYSEIDTLSDKIAGYVLSLGLGRSDVVSVLIPRGEYMPIASLGALKAGCAYQPLDTSYPPERLNFMVKDSGAKLLITTAELRSLITDYSGEILLLEDIPALPDLAASLPEVKPEDLFILLYTSGSTGTPKGVRLTHANLVCVIEWYHKYYDLQPEDCAAAYASYGFDACMFDMYPALTKGSAVCIIPEEIRLDLNAVNEYIEANNVTHMFMTTQVGRQFAESVKNHSLRHLTVGGEKLVPLDPPTAYKLHNGYGPTETTLLITVYHVAKNEENIPIGKALDNVKLYVVDKYGHRVPAGALGELYAAGSHVGDGYLNRPDKTAEVFITNPFDSSQPKMYKTGDIVRYLFDGNI